MTETADAVRRQFLSATHTYAFTQRDYPDWHQGRERYYVWVIMVDTAAVNARLLALKEHLRGVLVAPYRRQAHVTLHVPGFAEVGSAQQEVLVRQKEALAQLRLSVFDLQVAGANSFLSAPFLDVSDSDASICSIRRCLQSIYAEERVDPYHPHITAGLYAREKPVSQIDAMLAPMREQPDLRFSVRKISLCYYAPNDIGSRLREVDHVALADRV